MKRVRVNATYRYVPCLMDRVDDAHLRGGVQTNDRVKVVNRSGCPAANMNGMCYIEKDGKFIGMVCNASLHKKACHVQLDDRGHLVPDKPCTCDEEKVEA